MQDEEKLTVDLVLREIRSGEINWVRWIPTGLKYEPNEVWLEELCVWVRVGSDCAILPAQSRWSFGNPLKEYYEPAPTVYPGWFDRWRIRRAVKCRMKEQPFI